VKLSLRLDLELAALFVICGGPFVGDLSCT